MGCMMTPKEVATSRSFPLFFLLWLGASYALTLYDHQRSLLGQILISLVFLAQFLVLSALVKAGRNAGPLPEEGAAAGQNLPAAGADVRDPRGETLFLLTVYLLAMGIEITLLKPWFLMKRRLELIAAFWVFYVAVPAIYFRLRGYSLSDLGITSAGLTRSLGNAVLAALVVLPFLVSSSSSSADFLGGKFTVGQLLAGTGAGLVYGFLMAGFFEEFFFRALLQTRLARLAKSEADGMLISSVLFGLYHLPSRIIQTDGNWGHAFALTLSAQMVISPILGLLWARSRNLALPVFVHSFMDGMSGFSRIGKAIGIIHE